MTAAVAVCGLTVAFGAFRALDALSLEINYGEIRALIGPNGAGKTTLLDVVSGLTRARGGSVLLDGRVELTRVSQAAIARGGVCRKFQKPSVFEALTVRENLEIGGFGHPGTADRVMAEIGLADIAQRPAGELAHGQKQWLELGMVLATEPRVLLLDEPLAGLSDEETERTVALVRRLLTPQRAIVIVEHDMDFVERIADRVSVLHEGRLLFEGSMVDARRDPRVIDVYLGR